MDFHPIPDAKGHLPAEVGKNSAFRRKIRTPPFFPTPSDAQEQNVSPFPSRRIRSSPAPSVRSRIPTGGHCESFALVLPPLGQAAAEVHIRYSIHSIADMDLLTAAYKNRPARNGAERYLPAHPSGTGADRPFPWHFPGRPLSRLLY